MVGFRGHTVNRAQGRLLSDGGEVSILAVLLLFAISGAVVAWYWW